VDVGDSFLLSLTTTILPNSLIVVEGSSVAGSSTEHAPPRVNKSVSCKHISTLRRLKEANKFYIWKFQHVIVCK
jgi:hypothetical protein